MFMRRKGQRGKNFNVLLVIILQLVIGISMIMSKGFITKSKSIVVTNVEKDFRQYNISKNMILKIMEE